MKIVVLGPGAIGCLVAAFLSKTKEDVWLLDKDKNRAHKLQSQGIFVEGMGNPWHAVVKVSADAKAIGEADVLIVCVKCYDTKTAIKSAKPCIGRNTYVVTLQNGLGNIENIGEIIGQERLLAGITNQGSTLIGVGKVRHAGKGETSIGRIDGEFPVELRQIRDIFNKSGWETKISRDIKVLVWSKLVVNVGINVLTALTRLPNGKIVEYEGTRRLMRQAVTEAVKVAKRKRVKLLYDDPLAKVESVCEATSTNVCSMLQDVLNHRRTEVDYVNGVIVRHAQELGIAAPVNTVLVDLIKTVESSYDAQVDIP
ncbi:MAG TPA: 2-dehydropantoate 2-reductase [Candidatus Omnitrophota bacterium]|nr:2-dehydropantoate 2-reductase [Candidatus Omnitrophota bacterium]HPT07851.1 2-dehydropantoate 2-reductase [Candidatus Omnitrophota bacterium]